MTIHEQREINQFSLATFAHDAYNRLDYATDQAILQLKLANEKTWESFNEMERTQREDPLRWKELEEQADRMDINLDGQMNGYVMDTIFRTEEMMAIMEMKIIYAYKHLEINLKKLLAAAYPGTPTKDFYKWESMIAFLRSKIISPEHLPGYAEVVQLKDANNSLKHNDRNHKELQRITEFRDFEVVSYESLEVFYNRVKGAPLAFLKALTEAIYKEQYEFNEAKLCTLAETIVLRMDKEKGTRLAEMIVAHYQ